jgi:hypothetical protein
MKNKKLILGLLVVGAVGFYMYKKYKGKSQGATSSFSGDDGFFNSSFSGDDKFFNFTKSSGTSTTGKSKSCHLVDGSVNVGSLPYRLGSGDYIISTSQSGGASGNGQTLICPEIPRGGVNGVVL